MALLSREGPAMSRRQQKITMEAFANVDSVKVRRVSGGAEIFWPWIRLSAKILAASLAKKHNQIFLE